MTVAELIEALKAMPQEAEAFIIGTAGAFVPVVSLDTGQLKAAESEEWEDLVLLRWFE